MAANFRNILRTDCWLVVNFKLIDPVPIRIGLHIFKIPDVHVCSKYKSKCIKTFLLTVSQYLKGRQSCLVRLIQKRDWKDSEIVIICLGWSLQLAVKFLAFKALHKTTIYMISLSLSYIQHTVNPHCHLTTMPHCNCQTPLLEKKLLASYDILDFIHC